ncbi:FUSC family protein [Nonomuraea sp. NPDC049129]|uniref:FUSC family protein n=1 Tax=Nonomuraea sp. NPDC049129 TaxID=3155272 RepID=UPI00340A7FDB
MIRTWRGRLARALRGELAYIRGSWHGLATKDSHQRLQARQIGKATLAAVLAWFLASRLLPHESIWIAPATAVIMVHATVYQTLTNGLRRVAAVAAGVILAGSIGSLIGLTALSLVLVIPPALLAARWRRMGRYGSDVATTAVLMLSFGAASQERYLLAYIIATAMGAVSGAAINTLLWPPLYHRRPDAAFRRLAEQGAALLGDVADGLRQGWDLSGLTEWQAQATRLTERLDAAEAAVAAGAESRRYNLRRLTAPPGRDHTPHLRTMAAVSTHIGAIIQALAHLDHSHTPPSGSADVSDAFARDYADLLDRLGDILTIQVRHSDDPDSIRDQLARAQARAIGIHEEMSAEIQAGRVDHPEGWAVSGSLLTDAHRIMILLADGHDPTMVAPAQGPH